MPRWFGAKPHLEGCANPASRPHSIQRGGTIKAARRLYELDGALLGPPFFFLGGQSPGKVKYTDEMAPGPEQSSEKPEPSASPVATTTITSVKSDAVDIKADDDDEEHVYASGIPLVLIGLGIASAVFLVALVSRVPPNPHNIVHVLTVLGPNHCRQRHSQNQ